MLTIIPFAVCLMVIIFLREVPPSTSTEEEKKKFKYFTVFNVIVIAVAIYLQGYNLIANPSIALSLGFAIVLLVLLPSPLAVSIQQQTHRH